MAVGDVPPPAPEPEVETAGKEKGKAKERGLLRRMWDVIFHGRGDDFEKRLQYLSKEEAAAHARMKRRAQGWRKTARNVVVCSVVAEVFAVVYAIITTRTEELTLQMRSLRVFPMFLLPGVSYVIYSALHSFTRMRDRKDQKTLERLRAERQAKIDELKERTNYYTTQQLIQKYDLDPAAKAAAASVLASKLGAESGLRVSVDMLNNEASGRGSAVEVPPTEGLRNRKHPRRRSTDSMSSAAHYSPPPEGTYTTGLDGQTSTPVPAEQFVEHYKGSGGNSEGGWIARLAAMLVGEDPSQSYALICGNCRMHNGLARKEDFPYITYYCPHCHALNGHRHAEGQGPGSSPASRSSRSPASESAVATPKGSSSSVTLATSHPATDASPAISEADATEHPAIPVISETDATDHPDINASPPIPKADPAIDASPAPAPGGDTPDTAATS